MQYRRAPDMKLLLLLDADEWKYPDSGVAMTPCRSSLPVVDAVDLIGLREALTSFVPANKDDLEDGWGLEQKCNDF